MLYNQCCHQKAPIYSWKRWLFLRQTWLCRWSSFCSELVYFHMESRQIAQEVRLSLWGCLWRYVDYLLNLRFRNGVWGWWLSSLNFRSRTCQWLRCLKELLAKLAIFCWNIKKGTFLSLPIWLMIIVDNFLFIRWR